MRKMKKALSVLLISCTVIASALCTTLSVEAASFIVDTSSSWQQDVLDMNLEKRQQFQETADPNEFLDMPDAEMKELSDKIVSGIENDYDKVKAIHDWVCGNIYYATEGMNQGYLTGSIVFENEEEIMDYINMTSGMSTYEKLITLKYGTCSYYSSIFMDLVRAQKIPCIYVSGFAGHTDAVRTASHTNHAWNEAYVAGRWIIVDTTWDSGNTYDGEYHKGFVRDTYFDIGDGEFAKSHKIMEYPVVENENPAENMAGFVDVFNGDYYDDAVEWAVENEIVKGTSSTTFSPAASCTRAQMVTFLWRAAGSPAEDNILPFNDVDQSAYYADAVCWAVHAGITQGTSDTTFSPDAVVSRAQVVTLLHRYQNAPFTGGRNLFIDVPADAYYTDAVLWAVDKGVTTGTSATTFSPNDDCLRAQIVTFLYRALSE